MITLRNKTINDAFRNVAFFAFKMPYISTVEAEIYGRPCAKLHGTHNTQKRYMQISCTEFFSNQKINVASRRKYSCGLLSKIVGMYKEPT